MNKKLAIDKFIEDFQDHAFGSDDFELWLRGGISNLVEEIYKEELEISDNRWKRAEQRIRELEK